MVIGHRLLVVPVCTGVTAPKQLSLAVTAGKGGIWLGQLIPRLPGTPRICGGIVSATVITCTHSLKFPHRSLARYVRVTVITHALVLIWSPTCVRITVPQSSVAVIKFVFTTGTFAKHCTVTLLAHPVITGRFVSLTVIV